MKPIERTGYADVWIIVQQDTSGKLSVQQTVSTDLGFGIFSTEQSAQHQQTIELLRGNRVEIYKLEWPIK